MSFAFKLLFAASWLCVCLNSQAAFNSYLQYSQTGVQDPTAIATAGNTNSLFFKSTAPVAIFRKLDNGTTINWEQLSSFPASISGNPTQIAFFDGGGVIASETGVDPDSFTWDATNNFLGIQQASPLSILHVGSGTTAGTVGTNAIIIGVPNAVNNIGDNAVVTGTGGTASGARSFVEGENSQATADNSHAEGFETTATQGPAHAEGYQSDATGFASHAENAQTTASGDGSHAEGDQTISLGASSHAEGQFSQANANRAHAEGQSTIAAGIASHSEGQSTQANSDHSHAEGLTTIASNNEAHAEGRETLASGLRSHAEGFQSSATGDNSHAEGQGVSAGGTGAHGEGSGVQATGNFSHAEGESTNSGVTGIASGVGSHLEGGDGFASGDYSHSGGQDSNAQGDYSFAHGRKAQTGANNGTLSLSDSQNFTSTNTLADSTKLRYSNGFDFVKGGGADDTDGVNLNIFQATVLTTNNSFVTIRTVATVTDTVNLVEARILGRRTGGAAGTVGDSTTYIIQAKVKNIAGVVTVSNVQFTYTTEDNAATDAQIIASGTDYLIDVKGDTNNNYTWDVTTLTQTL